MPLLFPLKRFDAELSSCILENKNFIHLNNIKYWRRLTFHRRILQPDELGGYYLHKKCSLADVEGQNLRMLSLVKYP